MQLQIQTYETALEVRVARLRGFVKELMLGVEQVSEKVESNVEKDKKERDKDKTKFYRMSGIFSVIGAGILLWVISV